VSKVDLHIHSTASDGRFGPEEIIRKSVERGLTIIAITDHDNVDSIAPALATASAFPRLKVIPGIEVSTNVPRGEVHILGYFIDYNNHELQATLKGLHNSRWERAKGMVAKLENLGISISWQRVREIAGNGSIGRPHIAQAMLEKGYITSFKEAFNRYIGKGGPAYVNQKKPTPPEAVRLILQSNGLPVLAHPLTIDDPEMTIAELKAVGLVGIEAHYNNYTADEVYRLVSLANKYNLITTGGSDYHGLGLDFETDIGGANVPMESAKQLIALAEQRLQKLV